MSPKACSFHHCPSGSAALSLHVQGEPGPSLQFSNLFSLWIPNYFLSTWRSLIEIVSLMANFLIFQHLTVVHCYNTRKWTRPMTDPWYWTSATNMKYYVFLPTSIFPDNLWADFRVQYILTVDPELSLTNSLHVVSLFSRLRDFISIHMPLCQLASVVRNFPRHI